MFHHETHRKVAVSRAARSSNGLHRQTSSVLYAVCVQCFFGGVVMLFSAVGGWFPA